MTDDDGTFSIAGLRDGDYVYSARSSKLLRLPWAEPADPDRPMAPRELQLRDDDVEVELVLAPEQSLRGVARGPDGRPRAGVWVEAWPHLPTAAWADAIDTGTARATNMAATQSNVRMTDSVSDSFYAQMSRTYATQPVLTDAQGRFEIPGCRRSAYVVSGLAQGGDLRAELAGVMPGDEIELVLEPQATLVATLAPGSKPGGSYRITVEGPDVQTTQARAEQREVILSRLRPGEYRVVVEARHGVAARRIELEPGKTSRLSVSLDRWSRLRGKVVDASGGPVGGLVVTIDRRHSSLAEVMASAQEMMASMMGKSDRRVESDGSFVVDRLAPGRVKVTLHSVPAFEIQAVIRAELDPAQDLDVGEVRLLEVPSVPTEQRGWLGVSSEVVDDSMPDPPLSLVGVEPGGPAARAGVREGDEVVAVDGIGVDTVAPEMLARLLARTKPGQSRTIEVSRDGQRHSLTIVAGPVRGRSD